MTDIFVKAGKSYEEVVQLLTVVRRKDIDNGEVQDIYVKWADQYEEDLEKVEYNQPLMCAQQVADYYRDNRNIRILDAAAGTGLVGKCLYDLGFKDIDALDASPEMLEKAKEKNCYGKFYEDYMGKNRLEIETDTYDAVVTSGSFIPGHVNEDCYEELIRIVKPGGHIFIYTNQIYFVNARDYAEKFEARMVELEKEGAWKMIVKKTGIPFKMMKDHNGVLYILQKC